MGSLSYVISYTAIARNVSADALAVALGAVPRDLATEAMLGLQALADVSVSFSRLYARRTISYTARPNAFASDPVLGTFLTDIYTSKFSQALSTPVIPTPVLFVPRPAAPVLWVNAQFGVSATADHWTDLGGSVVHDLIQSAVPNRAALSVNGLGPDVATVSFTGGAKFFLTAGPALFDDFTYLMTFRSPALSVAGMLFERSVDATLNSGERLYQSSGAPTHTDLARRLAVNHIGDFAVGWGVDGNWHQVALVYSHAAGGELLVDGVPRAPFSAGAIEAVNAVIFVGAQAAGTLPITGDVRELFVFPRALTPAELTTMADYMNPQVGL
jgi:hypothetical protein